MGATPEREERAMTKRVIFRKHLLSLFLLLYSSSLHAADFYILRSGGISFNWIYITGVIEVGDARRFNDFVGKHFADTPPYPVVLDSPGGDLVEGIKLGVLIRELGLNTYVDQPDDASFLDPNNPHIINGFRRYDESAVCASACSYAFLGGVFRSAGNNQVGLHQFSSIVSVDDQEQIINSLSFKSIESSTQAIMSLLVWYLGFLGDVDFKLLAMASITPPSQMYFLSEREAQELSVTKTDTFDEFFLEPYGNGIIAASRAIDSLTGYDSTRNNNSVSQATLFCKSGNPIMMLSSDRFNPVLDNVKDIASWKISFKNRPEVSFEAPMTFKTRNRILYVEVDASYFVQFIDSQLSMVEVEFWLPDRLAGRNSFVRQLTDREVKFLQAAIHFCI